MRKADHILMTLDDTLSFIESSNVTSEPLTRIMVDDDNLSMVGVAEFSAAAQERAVYHLMDTGNVIIHGVSKSDKVFTRFATIAAQTVYADAIDNGVRADRPQTAAEAKAQAHADLVASVELMKAEGVSQDDIIAHLLNG